MGNSSGKESSPDSVRPHSHRRSSNASPSSGPPGSAAATTFLESGTSSDTQHAQGGHSSARHASTHDFSFLGLGGGGGGGGSSDRDAATETRRETRAEKEARKLEKERAARVKERERSMKEEHVDGGFLVTMGTYTASEDFNKAIVRQLIIERRIAPFWRGLNDFSSSWTEHQLVAAARDLPIPAPDEIPAEFRDRSPQSSVENIKSLNADGSSAAASSSQYSLPLHSSNSNNNKIADASSTYSSSHPAFSSSLQPSSASPSTASPLFRGRAKTLASLTTFRNNSQADMTPQEVQLPKNPYVNGQPIEVFLYKNATECPICFLYFPPYFNKSRCCDQPICTECFVQIKRPEPHQPENLNPGEESQGNAEDAMLVSEPAQCPFCTEPEFGVTYDPPPFRRGLTHVNQASSGDNGNNKNAIASMKSATSSSSSVASHQAPGSQSAAAGVGRRRAVSLSANAPTVITTDRIRPDWAKKLADARAQTMRRSAAATALHNAAYLLNGAGGESRGFMLGRRRRAHFVGEGLGGSSNGGGGGDGGGSRVSEGMTPEGMIALLSGATDRRAGGASGGAGNGRAGIDGHDDLFPGRTSSRRTRVEELEDMMMMEAIRQSLQAEEDRKQKEDKEASKAAKKEEKKRVKAVKKAEKAAKKRGDRDGASSKLYKSNTTSSSSFTNNSVISGPSHASTNNNLSSSSYYGTGGNDSLRLDGSAVTSHDRTAMTSGSEISEGTGTIASGKKGKEPDRVGFATSTSWTPSAANAGRLVPGRSQQHFGLAEGASTATATPKDHNDPKKKTNITQSSSSSISSSNLTSSGSSSSTTTTSSPLRSRSRSGSGSGSGSRPPSDLASAVSPTAPSLAPKASTTSTVKLVPASTSTSTSASASASTPRVAFGAERTGTAGNDVGYSGNGRRARDGGSGSDNGNGNNNSGSDSKQSTELPLTGFQSLAAMIEAGMPAASASASAPSSSSATGRR